MDFNSPTGTAKGTFLITGEAKTDISKATVSAPDQAYTGSALKPTPTVKLNGTTLKSGTDYTVAYSNNTNVGTATITVTGKGSYTGTAKGIFRIVSKKESFEWGGDNWNFNNSSVSGDFKSGTYADQISGDYLAKLKSNLTNTEYRCVFVDQRWGDGDVTKAWINETWQGSCYGMSSTALLAKEGLLPYSSYKSGASLLYSLDRPTSSTKVSSLITYYQMLQVKDVIQQQYRTVKNKSNQENITNIINTLGSSAAVLIGYQRSGWGGHAVLAYGYEYGSWTWDGVTYGGRIKICDPNSSKSANERYDIYFNTKTYSWAIPAYSAIKSTSGAVFNYVGANVKEINKGGYLSGPGGASVSGYVARIDAPTISDNRSVSKVMESSNGTYTDRNNAPGEIYEDYSYVLAGTGDGLAGYNLYDSESAYRVSQQSAERMQVIMRYEGCLMEAGSAAGKNVVFDKRGYVEVRGESANYTLSMTYDEGYPTDWFTMSARGTGSDKASLEMVDGGYVIAADNLSNVTLNANNRGTEATKTFTTDYDSAFVYEKNENTIGVKVDTDGNGTYETELGEPMDISSATVSKIADQTYTGKEIKPAITVKLGSKTLKGGTDYTVAYANNIKVGTATVTVMGKGGYAGTKKVTFKIVKAQENPFVDVTSSIAHNEDILWLASTGISTGWDTPAGKEFRPNANVKRGDMAAFLFRLAKQWGVLGASDSWAPSAATKKKFTDVTAKTSHSQAIWWMAENGISAGWDVGGGRAEFRPNADVKRGDLAAFLGRLADKAGRKGSAKINKKAFLDVTSKTSHADEIWWMAASGISSGWDVAAGKEFRPNANVKRGDMAAFLHRLDSVR